MILSDTSLTSLALNGLVTPFIKDNVQGSSIDLTLGSTIKVESPSGCSKKWVDQSIVKPYSLAPGEFVLAHTAETIKIPKGCAAMVSAFALPQRVRGMSTAWLVGVIPFFRAN